MLLGNGYVVAERGDKNVSSDTAACFVLSGSIGRVLRRLTAHLPLSMRRILGVRLPLRED